MLQTESWFKTELEGEDHVDSSDNPIEKGLPLTRILFRWDLKCMLIIFLDNSLWLLYDIGTGLVG